MIIFYHNADLDGKCSGFLCRYFAKGGEDANLFGINYGDEFPFNLIYPDEFVYIVDYSIEPEEMASLLNITKNVIWIDHHDSAIRKYNETDVVDVEKIDGIRRNSTAACELCWEYFNEEPVPMFVGYIADRDVWTWEFGQLTDYFNKGMELEYNSPDEAIWVQLINEYNRGEYKTLNEIVQKGTIVKKYRKQLMDSIIKDLGHECQFSSAIFSCEAGTYKQIPSEWHNMSMFFVNQAKISSDDFPVEILDEYDMVIGGSFDGEKWRYSLRTVKDDIKVNLIAEFFGGGGHPKAAGFSSDRIFNFFEPKYRKVLRRWDGNNEQS